MLVMMVDMMSRVVICVILACRMWPSLQAISPLEGSLCHCLEPQVGHRRRGAIANFFFYKWISIRVIQVMRIKLHSHDQLSGGITQGCCQQSCVSLLTSSASHRVTIDIGGQILRNDEIAVSTLYRIDFINIGSFSVRQTSRLYPLLIFKFF